jgi:hypothetical protein
MEPLCEWCVETEEECRQKAQGLGCERCAQWKVGCSTVGLKRKGTERKIEWRVIKDTEEGPVALLELSNRVMEQVEAMAKELKKISGGIWALVEGMRKKRVAKADKEMEMEEV